MFGLAFEVRGYLPEFVVAGTMDRFFRKIALIVIAMQLAMPLLKRWRRSACGAFLPRRGQPLFDKVARRWSDGIGLTHHRTFDREMARSLMRIAIANAARREGDAHVSGLNSSHDGRIPFIVQHLFFIQQRRSPAQTPDPIVDVAERQATAASAECQNEPATVLTRIGDLHGMQNLRSVCIRGVVVLLVLPDALPLPAPPLVYVCGVVVAASIPNADSSPSDEKFALPRELNLIEEPELSGQAIGVVITEELRVAQAVVEALVERGRIAILRKSGEPRLNPFGDLMLRYGHLRNAAAHIGMVLCILAHAEDGSAYGRQP